jgi:hypothetical protein
VLGFDLAIGVADKFFIVENFYEGVAFSASYPKNQSSGLAIAEKIHF